MREFQYQIVRYIHDRISEEFVNVGIVVYQPESEFLKGMFIKKFSRISHFFSDVNGQFLLSSLRQIEHEINIIADRFGELFTHFKSLEEVTASILPKDESSLVCSEVLYGLDVDPQSALDDLFHRLVEKYSIDEAHDTVSDKVVWQKVYKQYFDKYGVTGKLKPFSVKTLHDHIDFERAWKNGVWNCYQTLSLDLKRTDSIKSKVYKWSGILSELANSDQKLHLYFLTKSPARNRSLQKFIEDTLIHRDTSGIEVTLVNEMQADKFVKTLKEEIDAHFPE